MKKNQKNDSLIIINQILKKLNDKIEKTNVNKKTQVN